ncbi:MAG: VOC family protein [Bacteroidales bacterium]|nr:VOC family protein [Bacteroidales bacterium]
MNSITPLLWFDHNAQQAVDFYLSVFKDSKILKTLYFGKDNPVKQGEVMTISFQMLGQTFTALNGGPHFSFTPAISFVINCATEKEVDYYWDRLSEGGEQEMCGWLKDQFGLSWQVVPDILAEYLSDTNEARSERVMKALMQMHKLSIPGLRKAYEEA